MRHIAVCLATILLASAAHQTATGFRMTIWIRSGSRATDMEIRMSSACAMARSQRSFLKIERGPAETFVLDGRVNSNLELSTR